MPLNHLMLSLFGGLVAAVAAVVAGLPIWMAALLYTGVGSLLLVLSVAMELWVDHSRRPPRRRTAPGRRAAELRVAHGH